MRKLFILLTLILTLTSCQHLTQVVKTSNNNFTESKKEKTLYYTFRVLDKNLNLKYVEEFQDDPNMYFYRDVSHLVILDTLQWGSENSYTFGH